MGLISTIKGAFNRVIKSPFSYYPLNWRIPPSKKETDWLQVFSENVWVYSAVSRIAQSVSMTKWKLVTTNSEGEEIEITDESKYSQLALLKRPNPFMTWQEFSELSQIFLELTGESYWVISFNGLGEPAELWPVPPDRMWVVPDKDDFISGYVYIFAGENLPFDPKEVIHLKYPNPLNVYKGVGPTQAAGYLIDIDTYGNQFSKNFFYNGATPGGVIESPQSLTTEEYNRIREQWELSHTGVDKAHRVGILEGGATYKPIELNLQNIQLIENRKQNREDILAGFGVPNSVLGISDNVNKANAEVGEITFAKRTIKPRLIKLSEKINYELLTLFKNNSKLRIKLVFDEVTPEDQELTLKKVQAGVTIGIITINEARAKLGFDPLENGDVLMIPSTVKTVDIKDLATITEAATTQTTAAAELAANPPENNPDGGPKKPDPKEPDKKPSDGGKEPDNGKDLKKKFTIDKALIASRFLVEQAKNEKAWKKALAPVWREMKSEALENLKKGENENLFDNEAFIDKFSKVGLEMNEKTFNHFAEMAYKDINPVKSLQKGYDSNLERIMNFIKDKSFRFARLLTEETEAELRKELMAALKAGEDLDQIMRRIAEVFDIAETGYRSERIARTESMGAANAGALEGYLQTGLVKGKEWIATYDERTRHSHAAADGQVTKLSGTFTVDGEKLAFPGDPNGSAGNIINCRCCIAPTLDN